MNLLTRLRLAPLLCQLPQPQLYSPACLIHMYDPPLIWQESPPNAAASKHLTSLQPSHISQLQSETSKAKSTHDTWHGPQHSQRDDPWPELRLSTFSICYTRWLQPYVQTVTLRSAAAAAAATEGGTLSTKAWSVMTCWLKALTVGHVKNWGSHH